MSLSLFVISPERRLFEGEVSSVTLPGAAGGFAVLSGHAPLVSKLQAGIVEISGASDTEMSRFVIESGFAEVKAGKVTVLVEKAWLPDEIDADKEEAELSRLLSLPAAGDHEISRREAAISASRSKLAAVR